MTERITHKLAVPIALPGNGKPDPNAAGAPMLDGEKLTEVTVRSPTVRDLRVTDAHQGDVAKAAALLARLSGLDIKTVDQLDAQDFEALSNIIGDFSGAPKAVE